MKRFSVGICAVATLVNYSALADGIHVLNGCGFTAPNVIGDSNVENAQIGDIVFDTSTSNFYGYSGGGWIQLGTPANSQGSMTVFTTSGTFTTPATSSTTTVYHYKMIGAGGGGNNTGTSSSGYVAQPGAAGGYAEGTFTGVSPSTAITITIGAGGAGGVVGSSPVAGSAGGSTSIGAPVSITCTGGAGGASGGTVVSVAGGTCSGSPQISLAGMPGGLTVNGTTPQMAPGSIFGPGVGQPNLTAPSTGYAAPSGRFWGSAGAAATCIVSCSGTAGPGGSGAGGVVIISQETP